MTLSRDQILNSPFDAPTDTLSVPSWGGDVRIRPVNMADHDVIRFTNQPTMTPPAGRGRGPTWEEPSDEEKRVRRIIARTIKGVVDDQGSQVFSFDNEDVEWLRERFNVTVQVAAAIVDLNSEFAAANMLTVDEGKDSSETSPD